MSWRRVLLNIYLNLLLIPSLEDWMKRGGINRCVGSPARVWWLAVLWGSAGVCSESPTPKSLLDYSQL